MEVINRKASDFCTPVPKCSPLVEVAPNRLWYVTGHNSIPAPVIVFNVTMTIIKAPSGGLTLFNATRLPANRDAELRALGPIENIVRLGSDKLDLKECQRSLCW